MKKIVFILILVTAIKPIHSSAQFLIGPQAGFSYATLTGTHLSLTPKPEWHAGLLFDLGFGKHFSLQPSLLYSKRGYKYDYSTSVTAVPNNDTITTYTTVNVDAALGYIDIPVLLNVYLGDHHGFMINAGPQLSILLNNQSTASTVTNTTSAGSTSSSPETETKFKFNPTDISLVGGVGYKFPMLLLVYLRASTGFGKVQKGSEGDSNIIKDENAGHHFTIQAGLALTFGGK